MPGIVWLIVAFMAGSFFGLFVSSLCVAASRGSRDEEARDLDRRMEEIRRGA